MVKWLTSVFLVITVAYGGAVGASLHTESSGMSKCCDKAKSGDRTPQVQAAVLCCALNCTDPAPTSSGIVIDLSTTFLAKTEFLVSIEDLVGSAWPGSIPYPIGQNAILRSNQPKYIQTHSFLI